MLILAGLATVAGADAAQTRPAPAERAVSFTVGERLEYDVSWSSYLTAGTVVLQVAEKRPSLGSVAYYVTGEAQPSSLISSLYTIYYKADTLIDVYSLLPQRGSVFSREGKRQRMRVTSFDHNARKARFEMQTSTHMVRELQVPTDAQDVLSMIYALRQLPLEPGRSIPFTVSDGGYLYTGELAVTGREAVAVPAGKVRAIRVAPRLLNETGEAIAKDSVLWLSDDARHVPLRLDMPLAAGRFVLSLRTMPAR